MSVASTVITMEPSGSSSRPQRLQALLQQQVSSLASRVKQTEDTRSTNMTKALLLMMLAVLKRFWAFSSLTVLAFLLLYYLLGGLTTLVLLAMSVSGLFYQISDKLLYHPDTPASSRLFVPAPNTQGMQSFQSEFVFTRDKVRIHLFFIEHKSDQAESKDNKREKEISTKRLTILYLHGNAGNIGHRLIHAKQLCQALNCNVCLLEYRGYGHSDGQPNEGGLYKDAQAGLDYLVNHLKVKEIVVFGRSLGGAVAIDLASRKNNREHISALILENTFTSIPAMARCMFNLRIVKIMPNFCYKNVYDSRKKICGVSTPTLFISGLKDALIPSAMMNELFEHCGSELKRLARFEDGNHNDTWISHNYLKCITYFLKEVACVMECDGVHRMDTPSELVSTSTLCI